MKYLVIGAGGTGGCIAGYMKRAGKVSEIDGLIHGVVRMGRDAGVELPTYALISEALKDLK